MNPVRGRWPGADHPRGWAAWDGGHVETVPAPVEAVWHALSDNDARDQWFSAGSALDARAKSHEFRVGGHGTEEGQWHGGPESRFLSTYTDIVDLQRIVFTYDMWVDGRHLSTSLTTIALERDGGQTRLTYTEQGVHFEAWTASRAGKRAAGDCSTSWAPISPPASEAP